MTLRSGPIHHDVRASTRNKGTWSEKSIPKHHTISWTDNDAGTTLKVKIFSASDIEISLNGTFSLSAGELLEINDEIRAHILRTGEQP